MARRTQSEQDRIEREIREALRAGEQLTIRDIKTRFSVSQDAATKCRKMVADGVPEAPEPVPIPPAPEPKPEPKAAVKRTQMPEVIEPERRVTDHIMNEDDIDISAYAWNGRTSHGQYSRRVVREAREMYYEKLKSMTVSERVMDRILGAESFLCWLQDGKPVSLNTEMGLVELSTAARAKLCIDSMQVIGNAYKNLLELQIQLGELWPADLVEIVVEEFMKALRVELRNHPKELRLIAKRLQKGIRGRMMGSKAGRERLARIDDMMSRASDRTKGEG